MQRWRSHKTCSFWDHGEVVVTSDVDDGDIRAPGLELWGESLGQTRVVIPGNGDVFLRCYLVGGIARICSD